MKNFIYIVLLLGCWHQSHAQDNSVYRIKTSNLGSSGSSQHIETENGTYKVSQSIGQASVIGTHHNNGYVLRQGYQQPLEGRITVETFNYNLEAKVYPNPFNQELIISFSQTMATDISTMIIDLHGKIIHVQEFLTAQEVTLQLKDISAGMYVLKVVSGIKRFNTKLIKI